MKVNGIGSSRLVNMYNDNIKESKIDSNYKANRDSIFISSAGKRLSTYSPNDDIIKDSKKKIESIKKAIENGNYKVDAKLVAQKMIDSMKGRI